MDRNHIHTRGRMIFSNTVTERQVAERTGVDTYTPAYLCTFYLLGSILEE